MRTESKRKADFIMSIILICISLWFIVKSILLFYNPFSKDWGILTKEEIRMNLDEWYNSPGLIPLLFAICLLACSIILLIHTIKEKKELKVVEGDHFFAKGEIATAAKVIGYTFVYLFILTPACRQWINIIPSFQGFPFLISTFIYLSVFMVTFNQKTKKKVLISLFVSACASGFITGGFGLVAKILLP